MGARQEHSFPSSFQIHVGGEHRSWVSDLKQIPGGSPLSAYYTVHVSKSWYIWQTSPKPKRHNLPALKWWCGQSRAGAGGGRLGAAETPGRHHTSAGTQAVGAWMGFCHEWITTGNVRWGEDKSFTRLSLLIPCVHRGWAGGKGGGVEINRFLRGREGGLRACSLD